MKKLKKAINHVTGLSVIKTEKLTMLQHHNKKMVTEIQAKEEKISSLMLNLYMQTLDIIELKAEIVRLEQTK
jgi:hypothetical protein